MPPIATIATNQEQLSLKERLQAEKALRSFKLFCQYTWPIVEPGTALVWGWHMDAICEHLQAVYEGYITRLLVNMPPRHGKSTLISVMWPVWCLTLDPADKWLCASYVSDLAERDNRRSRDIINHYWYQQRYGDRITLKRDQNEKANWETTQGGYRKAVGITGSSTGSGGNKLLVDDPHKADDSTLRIAKAVTWFKETWSSRLNDREHGAMVTVGQRVGRDDVSGYLIEQGGWEHLNLPAEYDPTRKSHTSLGWSDPRKEPGELLWAAKFTKEVLAGLRYDLGPLAYHGQYNQSPVPPGGYTFLKSHERFFTVDSETYVLETVTGRKTFLIKDCWHFATSDLAISSKQSADFTVFAVWAVTPERDLLLLEIRREHWSHPDQLKQIKLLFQNYSGLQELECIYIESVAYQTALVQDALIGGIPASEYTPITDKVTRATSGSIWYSNEKVFHLKNASWLPELQKELFFFPKVAHDDIVDNVSMACAKVRERGPHVYSLEDTQEEKEQAKQAQEQKQDEYTIQEYMSMAFNAALEAD